MAGKLLRLPAPMPSPEPVASVRRLESGAKSAILLASASDGNPGSAQDSQAFQMLSRCWQALRTPVLFPKDGLQAMSIYQMHLKFERWVR